LPQLIVGASPDKNSSRWILSTKSFRLATAHSHNYNITRVGRIGRSVHLRIGYISEEYQREADRSRWKDKE